jgi:hypothetical protein
VVEFNGKEVTLNGSDIFDGIYVENKYLGTKTRKKREPKVARTQFEEETFEFAKGGLAKQQIMVSTYNQIDANDIIKYADLQNVKASLTKVGRMYKITLDRKLEERESMRSSLKQILYNKMTTDDNLSSWKHKQKNSNK